MAVICPTVTAYDTHQYREQMELLEKFAARVHIDLMDGVFAPTKSPGVESVWWPDNLIADVHLMYQDPEPELDKLIGLKPSLVIIHAEAKADHAAFARRLRAAGIKAGLALLQDTAVSDVERLLPDFDHVMIFSGNLGYHGGSAVDYGLLDKARAIKQTRPEIEIGWDGGVNDQNARQLAEGGVDALNVGGFIHKAADPQEAYAKLEAVVRASK